MKYFDKILVNDEYIKVKDSRYEGEERLQYNLTKTNATSLMLQILQYKIKKLTSIIDDLYTRNTTGISAPAFVSGSLGQTVSVAASIGNSASGSTINPQNIRACIIDGFGESYLNSSNVTYTINSASKSVVCAFSGIQASGRLFFYDITDPSRRSQITTVSIAGGPQTFPTYDYSVKKIYTSDSEYIYLISYSVLSYAPVVNSLTISIKSDGSVNPTIRDLALSKQKTFEYNGKGYTTSTFFVDSSLFKSLNTISLQFTFMGKTTELAINTADYI